MLSGSGGSRQALERDLYRKCLDLVRVDDPRPLLDEAVRLLREIAGARAGYIELRDARASEARYWTAAAGVEDGERARIEDRISKGVVAEAIETGETVHVASAMLDDRFSVRESVQLERIEAVLCVPLSGSEATGVVYLQNHMGGGQFSVDDVACVRAVAEYLGTLSARLLELQRRRLEEDRTVALRKRLRLGALVGRSAAIAAVLERMALLASMDNCVLITGPSGAGKTFFARLLHDNSPRRDAPFVRLDCSALTHDALQRELFGGESEGRVAAADGGTLFIDEISELPTPLQAKVLRLVQTGEYTPAGADQPRTVDVRILSATHRNLAPGRDTTAFRKDLYYQLRAAQLRVPALIERREDIPPLVRHFCAASSERHGFDPIPPSPSTLVAAEFFDWPGNVRELASACEEAVVNARLDRVPEIEPRHLFPSTGATEAATFQDARRRWESSFLEQTLTKYDWNVARTARALQMSRSHLNVLIRRCELRRRDDDL
ncbi:MAG: sigma 54-interacting transcriptional regulator [Nannocystaceae bacterium]|nr:sigma 54-interacting transcriptional regulator [bacterium]